jgi:hypothetical protein
MSAGAAIAQRKKNAIKETAESRRDRKPRRACGPPRIVLALVVVLDFCTTEDDERCGDTPIDFFSRIFIRDMI